MLNPSFSQPLPHSAPFSLSSSFDREFHHFCNTGTIFGQAKLYRRYSQDSLAATTATVQRPWAWNLLPPSPGTWNLLSWTCDIPHHTVHAGALLCCLYRKRLNLQPCSQQCWVGHKLQPSQLHFWPHTGCYTTLGFLNYSNHTNATVECPASQILAINIFYAMKNRNTANCLGWCLNAFLCSSYSLA